MSVRDFDDQMGEAFNTVEDAWFWTCGAIQARQQGVRSGTSGIKRLCDPDDVILCVERLLRNGQIGVDHARVLGRWGKQGVSPATHRGGAADHQPWVEAMMMLLPALRKKGIVQATRK